MADSTMIRPSVAIINLNSCRGCECEILNLDELLPDLFEQIDIVYWDTISSNKMPDIVDIAVVEGAVTSTDTIAFLQNLRNAAKKVIALGSCACGLDAFLPSDEKIVSIKDGEIASIGECIEVDYFVRGCPIAGSEFVNVIQKCVFGHNTFESSATLCGQCKENERGCFFGRGQSCLGLITTTGCGAICTSFGRPCMGCRGISKAANCLEVENIENSKRCVFETPSFSDMQDACSIKRFYDKDISGLNGDLAAFTTSRFNGMWSCACMLKALLEIELIEDICINKKTEVLRELLNLGEIIQNHISFIFYSELRKAYGFSHISEFIEAHASIIEEALSCRHAGTSICEIIGGRATHPITPVVGGFSVYPEISQIEGLLKQVTGEIDFAIRTVDMCNEVREKFEAPANAPVTHRILASWDNLSDEARFAAAKVGLVPGSVDPRRECVAAAVELVDAFARARDLCERYITVVSHD